ncbi:hypothetical protein [Paractinoplanes toevensis]|uniref:Uncharacterized protein n=1 Tax=Paractinoplanes toevensis TaxID=571911 RepID=A0A919T6B4_9ACTN|nr:hypothetical protein [Actinoplanes toevensis]GIM88801.1 hypothetical protein Ato02nite_005940 [Actinoplanes toevensis]
MTPDLYRTLRDIRDGHITLYVQVQRYDPTTGAAVEPREMQTSPDRMPAGVDRRSDPRWWLRLAAEGWLRLPVEFEPQIWQLTEAALVAVSRREAKP